MGCSGPLADCGQESVRSAPPSDFEVKTKHFAAHASVVALSDSSEHARSRTHAYAHAHAHAHAQKHKNTRTHTSVAVI